MPARLSPGEYWLSPSVSARYCTDREVRQRFGLAEDTIIHRFEE